MPDNSWECKEPKNSSMDTKTGRFYNFNLTYTPDFSGRPLSDKPKLMLTGACFDIVESMYPAAQLVSRLHKLNARAQVSWRDIFAEIKHSYAALLFLSQYSPTAEPSSVAFLRTLCADRLPIARQRESAEDLIPENIGHYKRDVGIALMRGSRGTFVYDAAWIAYMYDCMWTECGEESAKPSSLKSILTKTSKIAGLVVGIRNNEEDHEKRTRIAREYCSGVGSDSDLV
jgi:hypothetical protein